MPENEKEADGQVIVRIQCAEIVNYQKTVRMTRDEFAEVQYIVNRGDDDEINQLALDWMDRHVDVDDSEPTGDASFDVMEERDGKPVFLRSVLPDKDAEDLEDEGAPE